MGDERLRVVARAGAVTEIVFDHPPINIYDVATRDALCEVLTAVIADPGVRVVVFTRARATTSPPAPTSRSSAPRRRCGRCATRGGDATCGACSARSRCRCSRRCTATRWASASSSRCSATCASRPTTACVALPEARVGMIPAGGASQTLPRVVGTSAGLARRPDRRSHPRRSGARARLRRRGRAARRAASRAPTHLPTRSPRVPRRRCARPRPRCGRRSTCPSPSGWRGEADLARTIAL